MNVLRTYSTPRGFAAFAANQNRKPYDKSYVTEGNGATYTRTIDQDGRITGITIGGTTAVPATTTLSYTLDNADRVTALAETGQAAKSYGYDNFNHLTSINNGTNVSYDYGADSNRSF